MDGEVVEYYRYGHVTPTDLMMAWQKWLRDRIDLLDGVPYYHSSLSDVKARIAALPVEELA